MTFRYIRGFRQLSYIFLIIPTRMLRNEETFLAHLFSFSWLILCMLWRVHWQKESSFKIAFCRNITQYVVQPFRIFCGSFHSFWNKMIFCTAPRGPLGHLHCVLVTTSDLHGDPGVAGRYENRVMDYCGPPFFYIYFVDWGCSSPTRRRRPTAFAPFFNLEVWMLLRWWFAWGDGSMRNKHSIGTNRFVWFCMEGWNGQVLLFNCHCAKYA